MGSDQVHSAWRSHLRRGRRPSSASSRIANTNGRRQNPGIDATRLSYVIAFDRSTLGQVLERLEAKGIIERFSSPHDKRVKLVKLSQDGARLLAAVEPCVCRAMERLLGRLAPEDQQSFMRILTRLVELNNESSRAPLRIVASND